MSSIIALALQLLTILCWGESGRTFALPYEVKCEMPWKPKKPPVDRTSTAWGKWIMAMRSVKARRLKHGKPVAPAPETRRAVRENMARRAREEAAAAAGLSGELGPITPDGN